MGLRVGVIGTGKLGTHHVRVLKRLEEVDEVACYDVVPERSRQAAEEFGATACGTVDELLDGVDAVSVVVPTVSHASVSIRALERGAHLFLEKPIAASVAEADEIIATAHRRDRVLQVGHIERFNAAIRKAIPYVERPSFIEIHRLAPFTVRGIDVSVVMDLMIHDLDLLCMFLGEMPVDIRAKGAGILTDGPDIVNARLEYTNGCVANITASRVSMEPMRKFRIFSADNYLSIDLHKRKIRLVRQGDRFESSIARLHDTPADAAEFTLTDFLQLDEWSIDGEEPLYDELRAFCQTVISGERPPVTGEDGLRALQIATDVQRIVSAQRVR